MTQYGVWVTNKPVPFQRHRFAQASDVQEGVVSAGDYKVTQRALGANMSVDVAVGQAWVAIDTGARNGLAFVYSDAIENIAVGASDATNPRIDQLVLQYNDTSIPAGVGGDVPTLRLIPGVATAGATLDNRNGATALPADCVRFADLLIPAASVSVVTANIRDRRPWARGVQRTITRTAGDYTTVSLTEVDVDATNLAPRIECSGVPLDIELVGAVFHNGAAETGVRVAVDGTVSGTDTAFVYCPAAGNSYVLAFRRTITPAAGSHIIKPQWRSSGTASSAGIRASAARSLIFRLRETVAQDADNT